MKNILISNIIAVATTPIGCSVMGIPERKIEGITICNSRFVCTGGESEELADKKVEELEALYPEATMFWHTACVWDVCAACQEYTVIRPFF